MHAKSTLPQGFADLSGLTVKVDMPEDKKERCRKTNFDRETIPFELIQLQRIKDIENEEENPAEGKKQIVSMITSEASSLNSD